MRFLVDAQLPPALARWLEQQGHEAEHVIDVGLARAPDRDLWDYALRVDAAIVTKDEDFAAMLPIRDPAPAVVWLRFGNTSTRALIARLLPALPSIERALTAGEQLVELQ